MSDAIVVKGLSKSYSIRVPNGSGRSRHAEKVVLNDINFKVEDGEVLGVIGRNGAGKSTLLKILSRITVPTKGRAYVYGTVASLLEVGTGMHPEMTGRENVFLNGALLRMSKREIANRFDEIIDFAGTAEYVDTPIKHYSSGMKLRLAFAVAAHLTADVMIVDEVLAVGDAQFQQKCLGVMSNCSSSGRTVLFVSHNLPAVKSLCSRGIVLEGGRICFDGTADDGVDHYLGNVLGGAGEEETGAREEGGFRLERFQLLDADGEPAKFVHSGASCRIELSLSGAMQEPGPNLQIWVSGSLGERLVHLSSRLAGVSIPRFSERLAMSVDLGPLMLMPGQYYLNAALSGSRGKRLVQWERLCMLDVYPAPELPALSLPRASMRGVVYTPSQWRLGEGTR